MYAFEWNFLRAGITSRSLRRRKKNALRMREGWRALRENTRTTCVPDCRIKDTSRDGFRTRGTSRQLSNIKKWGKEETRREEVQRGWLEGGSLETRHTPRRGTRVSPCRNFRGLSCWLLVPLFLILSRSCLHFSRSIQYNCVIVHWLKWRFYYINFYPFVEKEINIR